MDLPHRIEMSPGASIELRLEDPGGGAVGSYDVDAGLIRISPEVPPEHRLEILLHEVLHAVEQMLVGAGELEGDVPHAFIEAAGAYLAQVLVLNGFLAAPAKPGRSAGLPAGGDDGQLPGQLRLIGEDVGA